MILCFFDTETTGLNHNKHEIIEYSIIVHINDVEKFRRTRRVKPLRINEADPEALKINGFDPRKWINPEHPNKTADFFTELIYQYPEMIFVGHNVQFDLAFLKKLCRDYHPNFWIKNRYIDTKCLAIATLFPLGLKSAKLDEIRRFLDWTCINSHRAEKDCEDARDLFYLCRKDLNSFDCKYPRDRIEFT
tara:strand:- start:709 stop:1278 length:570 start_codon:yes stop_codon:yes gene_type:complete